MGVPHRSSRPTTIRTREQIGDRIRSIRRSKKISQEVLGQLVGVERNVISRIELGRQAMTVDTAIEIAEHLQVPLAWLFTDDWSHSGRGGAGGGEPVV